MLVNFLPTGTLLMFEMVLPSIYHDGDCNGINTLMIHLLLLLCAMSCFFFHFNDSIKASVGKIYYGFVTPRGLAVFIQPPPSDFGGGYVIAEAEIPVTDEKYKLKNLGSGIDDGWFVKLLDHPDFIRQLVSREFIEACLILLYSLCILRRFRFFVDSSITCCGVIEELCTYSEGIFRHQSLHSQGDILEFVVVILCLSLWDDDCYGLLESASSFDGFQATPLAALVQRLSLIVKLGNACCFEDLMISIIMRLFLSEIRLIYKSLLQLQEVQSVEICLCSLSYGIADDI
ncbi:unnamed protein product [Arabis nemorensis]|uniref:Uncharacterized protein n=1 Tax=Arabis nemorensis TaxID=586526 RepID=A0A565CJL7_9BRAS|nr:unnamed protein product [Arabis nemorensis]